MARQRGELFILSVCIALIVLVGGASAATTSVQVVKYANDGTTVLEETTVTYQWMEANLPVLGDGTTHYYHQGPVFVDDPDEATEQAIRWNAAEDINVQEKDMGAVKGTNLKDLCDLVGGMSAGEEVKILSSDGFFKWFSYDNVYGYSTREGPIGLTWFMDGKYPDSGYSDGMRLVWFADASVNPWGIHAFGNYDWHEAADSEYWYYYMQGGENYPTTTGLSSKYVNRIYIYSDDPVPVAPVAAFTADSTSGSAPLTVQFTDQSTDAPTSWAWDFENDGTVDSTDQSPSHVYDTAGTYTVKLTVTNTAGSDDETKTDYIVVTEPPTIDEWSIALSGKRSQSLSRVDFATLADGNRLTYDDASGTWSGVALWRVLALVDDADPASFSDSAADLGYTVTVTAGDGFAKSFPSAKLKRNDSFILADTLNGTPLPGQYWPLRIVGSAPKGGEKVGNVSAIALVDFVAPAADVLYEGTVILDEGTTFSQVAYNSGSVYTVSRTTPLGALNATGLAYNVTDKRYSSDQTLLLDDCGQYLRKKPGYWYAYVNDYYKDGYGNHDNGIDVVQLADNDNVEFWYATGTFDPVDKAAAVANATAVVKITADVQAAGPAVPVAAFSADPSSGTAPLTVQFTDQSINTPTSWAWDFENDGTVDSTDQNPSHVYDTAGTYTVTLTATNAAGSDDEVKTDYIAVTSGSSADLLFDGDVTLSAGTFAFTAYNSGTEYQVDRLTPHGALDAASKIAGFTYNASDKKWATMATMLLDDVGQYRYDSSVSPKLCWAYRVNGVKKNDFSSTEGISVYRVNDGDLVEFYYGPEGAAFESALAVIRATVHVRDQTVLFDDDVTLLPGTFAFTAYNSGASYQIDAITPHGALDAASKIAGFTYNATDKKWSTLGTMLLDDIGDYRYNSSPDPDLVWAYAVNGVVKNDFSSTEGISVYTILNNDRVEFFYGPKGGTLGDASAVVRIRVHVSSLDDWTLTLKGAQTSTITKKYFEEAVGCIHNATYTDVAGTWGGVPLWALAGYVDDANFHGPNAFNDTRAAEGYKVKVIAYDTYNRTFNSTDIARNDGYIVANTLNGQPLPEQYWPLKLVGGAFPPDDSVAKISTIELSIAPIPPATESPSVRIVKYAADGVTEVANVSVNVTTMEQDFAVVGDGTTVYRYEGINFVPNDIWDANETYPGGYKVENAVKGTLVRDLCDLAGGMGSGTEIRLVASDGWETVLPYSSIYTNPAVQARQGDAVLAWYADGKYVPEYVDGMRLFFMPDDHIYGQWDMHETLASNYWHYYYQDGIQYPSCAGLSAKWITTIKIYSAVESDWSLELDGRQIGGLDYTVSKTYFEQALTCQFGADHAQQYVDTQGNVWEGLPLWLLAGFVDDADQHSDNAFNDTRATAGYDIVLTATDGAQTTVDSRNIVRNNNYIVANSLNGAHIPDTSSSWPLRLVGASATGSASLKSIAAIDLVPQSPVKLAFQPTNASVFPGASKSLALVLSEAPTGIAGCNVTVSLADGSVATITGIDLPSWATVSNVTDIPADSVTVKVLDLNKLVEAGAEDIAIATFTIRGDAIGSTQVTVTVNSIDDDAGSVIAPAVSQGLFRVLEDLKPINGVVPTDPDGDGYFDDMNGNGRLDFNDIVIFFNNIEWIASNEPVEYFDFNGNGRLDFDDVVEMFWKV